jgi:hypothetical protein
MSNLSTYMDFYNNTPYTLKLKSTTAVHGSWKVSPPPAITPFGMRSTKITIVITDRIRVTKPSKKSNIGSRIIALFIGTRNYKLLFLLGFVTRILSVITIVILVLLIPNYSQYILKLKLIIMVGIKIIVQIADIHFICTAVVLLSFKV